MPGQSAAAPAAGHNKRWIAALASLSAGAAFLAVWFWVLPRWLGFNVEMAGAARWRWLAVIPSVVGFAVALRCVWDFGWTGHGTPVPVAPPKRLVIVGFYRHVRNPMYVGFAIGWIGLWIVFGRPNPVAIGIVAAVAIGSISLLCSMRSRYCKRCSARSTKSIAGTYAAGGHVCGGGTEGNSSHPVADRLRAGPRKIM